MLKEEVQARVNAALRSAGQKDAEETKTETSTPPQLGAPAVATYDHTPRVDPAPQRGAPAIEQAEREAAAGALPSAYWAEQAKLRPAAPRLIARDRRVRSGGSLEIRIAPLRISSTGVLDAGKMQPPPAPT